MFHGGAMTRAQRTAIGNPCRFAFQTMNPTFRWISRRGVIVLTVNTGYE